jgi:hypothetical protein
MGWEDDGAWGVMSSTTIAIMIPIHLWRTSSSEKPNLRDCCIPIVPGIPSPELVRKSSRETHFKSAPSAAYSDQILGSRGEGYPSPGGWLEKPALKPIPNWHQVLHIAVKSLAGGCPPPPFLPLPPGLAGGADGEFLPEGLNMFLLFEKQPPQGAPNAT